MKTIPKDDAFFERTNSQWAAIAADPVALAEENREQAAWDATLQDGRLCNRGFGYLACCKILSKGT